MVKRTIRPADHQFIRDRNGNLLIAYTFGVQRFDGNQREHVSRVHFYDVKANKTTV